jgi:thioredoxin reductase
MPNPIIRYARWLHTMWPAGAVEKLPEIREGGSTNVPGVYVVGDLSGIPLLKFAADGGARVIGTILDDPAYRNATADGDALDVAIVGAGVSGMAAAVEAARRGLKFEIFEAAEPFSTIVNFPKAKPIYTYPTEMTPTGELKVTADVKETLIEELRAQTLERGIRPTPARVETVARDGRTLRIGLSGGREVRARSCVVAIGRSGNFRKLNVRGENLDKVYNRLHDPTDFAGRQALVVGGGDSAMEAAIALAEAGAHVTISYRKSEFSRPKPENVARLEKLARDPISQVTI